MNRLVGRILLCCPLLVLMFPAGAAVAKPVGALTQLPGIDGCFSLDGISEDGAGTCRDARAIGSASAIDLSPDGKFAYVTSELDNLYSIFARDATTGKLTQLPGTDGCISDDGTSEDGAGTCTNGRATLSDGYGPTFVFSPDGHFAYAVASVYEGLVIFSRDPTTGKLTQLPGTDGCITQDGSSEDGAATCGNGRALNPDGLAISPDGKTLYAPNDSGTYPGLTVFDRDATTGKLTQLAGTDGCITEDASSEDGAGTCANGKAVDYATTVVVSPDRRFAYMQGYSDNGISAFARDTTTGKLTQLPGTDGCVSEDGSSDEGVATCTDARALEGVWALAMSPDGKNLYASSYNLEGLVSFARDATTGKLTQLAGTDGCITEDASSEDGAGTCQDGRGAAASWTTTMSQDGLNIYVGQSSAGLVTYRRDLATGKATELAGLDGCYTFDGSSPDGPGTCTNVRGMDAAYMTAIPPGGDFVYAAANSDSTIGIFSRQIPPSCTDTSAKIKDSKAATEVPLTCSDPNGDVLTRSIVKSPAHGKVGAVNQSKGTVGYTPSKGYTGTDVLTFSASDGSELPSNIATAKLTDGLGPNCSVPKTKPKARNLRRNRLSISVICSESGTIKADLLVKRSTARKLKLAAVRYRKLGSVSGTTKSGTTKLKVKLTKKARKKLRKVKTKKLRKTAFVLRTKTTDSSGNKTGSDLRLRFR